MTARVSLAPGGALIVVSTTGNAEDTKSFDSLAALRAWREGVGAESPIRYVQYTLQSNSGWVYWELAYATAPKLPTASYMHQALQHRPEILGERASLKIDDDAEQLVIMIQNAVDPIAVVEDALQWYKPQEHGQPLEWETLDFGTLADGQKRIVVQATRVVTMRFGSMAEFVHYAKRFPNVPLAGVEYRHVQATNDPYAAEAYGATLTDDGTQVAIKIGRLGVAVTEEARTAEPVSALHAATHMLNLWVDHEVRRQRFTLEQAMANGAGGLTGAEVKALKTKHTLIGDDAE